MKRYCASGALILWLVAAAAVAGEVPAISFTEVTQAAGFDYQHGIVGLTPSSQPDLSEMAKEI